MEQMELINVSGTTTWERMTAVMRRFKTGDGDILDTIDEDEAGDHVAVDFNGKGTIEFVSLSEGGWSFSAKNVSSNAGQAAVHVSETLKTFNKNTKRFR
ncbi:MAG: hypothetical protein V1664_03600 [Candidatus Uhrbacteria bacterium]